MKTSSQGASNSVLIASIVHDDQIRSCLDRVATELGGTHSTARTAPQLTSILEGRVPDLIVLHRSQAAPDGGGRRPALGAEVDREVVPVLGLVASDSDSSGFLPECCHTVLRLPLPGADLALQVRLLIDAGRRARRLCTERLTVPAQYEDLYMNAPHMDISTDLEGRITRVNKTVATRLGYTREELVGRSIESLFDDGSRVRNQQLGRLHEDRQAVDGEPQVLVTRDGQLVEVLATCTRLTDENGVAHIRSQLIDVSRERSLERELSQAREALAHASHMASLGVLARGIAHEINNPLQIMIGATELLMMEPDVAQTVKSQLEMLLRHGARVKGVVQALQAFAQVSSDSSVAECVPASIADHLLEPLIAELERRSIRLVKDLDRTLGARIDALSFSQVLTHLLSNALNAMPQGGALTVRVRRAGAQTVLEVQDSGAGIPQELAARVWEPFFSTRDTGQGMGLGLSIVYGLVSRSGGTVRLRTEPGAGACVTVELPLCSVGRDTAGSTEASEVESLKILIVDDEYDIREVTGRLLRDLGHRVLGAATGHEGLKTALTAAPDLVLLDLMLPDMDGWTVLAGIRRESAQLPVVILTGKLDVMPPPGCPLPQGVVHKPFLLNELKAILSVVARNLRERGRLRAA